MNKLLIALAFVLPLTVQAAPSKLEVAITNLCESYGRSAKAIMQLRQEGMTKRKALRMVQSSTEGIELVEAAYVGRMKVLRSSKRKAVTDFSTTTLGICLASKAKRLTVNG